MTALHTPVMLQEVLSYLQPSTGKKYLDATVGYAGHTLGLLAAGASVIGIDRDADLLELATKRVVDAGYAANFTPMHSSFSEALASDRLGNDFSGILFDLGVSSYQLDTPSRGFSFRAEAPLDMRMDASLLVTAKDLVNGLGRKELYELFTTLGEDVHAKSIASAICDARRLKPIETTTELATLVERIAPRTRKIHPATKIFQALRMAVNGERAELKAALPSALSHLALGGVVAVISFHSLEDEIVKSWLREAEASLELEIITPHPVTPSPVEINENPRSRSGKLRVGRKIK